MTQNIKDLLEYQKIDAQLNALEKEILTNTNKITAQKMLNVFKNEQQNAENLEKEAGKAIEEFNKVKSIYETNANLATKLSAIDVEKLDDDKVEKLNSDLETVLNNLTVIEKKLISLNKNVETILSGFENAKKAAANARTVYTHNKTAYDEFIKTKTDSISSLKTALIDMQKKLNPALLKKYQTIRQDKIFPVLVPLNTTLCGYCQMGINANDANKLKEDGYIVCENCHRIIYL